MIWRGFGNKSYIDGDELGTARSLNNEEERPGVRGKDDAESCTTWHWHPAEVNVLSLSSDGAYLYSGKDSIVKPVESMCFPAMYLA